MLAPKQIVELVERFERNLEAYESGHYKEFQLRREFLDPFFTALGWDIENKQGAAEAYKDVIHEDTVKIGGATKAPDYCFRIGGTRKFFVEAKQPAINLKEDSSPAYQLRRYAWSAKLPISILTDFKEFVVYDCRVRPVKSDSASHARILYLTYKDFISSWETISSIFSREAVLKGLFDTFAESNKTKKGSQAVDEAFLKEIESWRDLLARNLALRNPKLSQPELNFCVQRIIDRILFLRICEDRGIEPYGRVMSLLNGQNTYPRLVQYFTQADDRYNSGLFYFTDEKGRLEPPDSLTPNLDIDDKVLRDIITALYYPESPYEFSVLSADILGQVYEQFLGKTIRLTDGHHAVVEEKPEIKKAGGVYYTPSYIVDYIVSRTVGQVIAGKSSRQVSKLKILDPACGSGSFLIAAYQYLLDWHRDQYVADGPEKHRKELYQGPGGIWRLTSSEKKRILLNNIFGVDVDSQAVEVSKLSLLLKVLESESDETIKKQLALFHERALPDLESNVKCGNSLIDPSFYGRDRFTQTDPEVRKQINAFDWNAEFPEIIASGGFDIVLGNPPYLNIDDTWGHSDPRLAALKSQYSDIYNDKTDILFYFLRRACDLSKNTVGFIVSRAFLEAYKADKLRGFLASKTAFREIVDFRNFHVFPGVGITTCVVLYEPKGRPKDVGIYQLRVPELPSTKLAEELAKASVFDSLSVSQKSLSTKVWTFASDTITRLNEKIDKAGQSLGTVLLIGKGMETGCNDVFGEKSIRDLEEWGLEQDNYYKRATNSDIQRYLIKDSGKYLLYLENVSHFSKLPHGVQRYLEGQRDKLEARAAYKRGDCEWWKYTWPLHKDEYNNTRLLCPYMAPRNRFAIDQDKKFLGLTDTTVLIENGQTEDLLYILGLLNSKLLTARFKTIGKLKSGGILEYFWNSISKLPIRRVNFKDASDAQRHGGMVKLVEEMLTLQTGFVKANTDTEKQHLQRQITQADRLIDDLTYELYGISPDEIKVIEGEQIE